MDNTREELPKFDFNDIPLMGAGVKIKLDCAKPVKSGMGGFGKMWNLWFGFVTNQKVTYGKGKDAKTVEGYTGKALIFPNEYANEQLIKLCNGNTDVEVEITRTIVEKGNKIFKNVNIKKLSEGRPASSSSDNTISKGEADLLADCENIIKSGFTMSEDLLVTASKDVSKYGVIPEQRVRELYKYFK